MQAIKKLPKNTEQEQPLLVIFILFYLTRQRSYFGEIFTFEP